jgi:hypothetical protein
MSENDSAAAVRTLVADDEQDVADAYALRLHDQLQRTRRRGHIINQITDGFEDFTALVRALCVGWSTASGHRC